MAPRRKPVVESVAIVDDWHLRPSRGRKQNRRVSLANNAPTELRPPPTPLREVERDFPRLAVLYEAWPAYSLDGPPEKPSL